MLPRELLQHAFFEFLLHRRLTKPALGNRIKNYPMPWHEWLRSYATAPPPLQGSWSRRLSKHKIKRRY